LAAVALAVTAALTGSSAASSFAGDPASSSLGAAECPAPGAALREPPQWVSHNGVLRVRIVVERRKVCVGDRMLWALTYDGHYMPPTLRFRPGDTLHLAMVNRLGQPTNLHVHGLHVSPRDHSDNIFVHIHPGETFHYTYRFPDNLAPGTYWYHSHLHGLTAPQVAGGNSGIIIVDGLKKYLPPRLRTITERVIALKDFQIDGDSIKTEGLTIGAPTNRTINGQLNPTITIRPGEIQLWRLSNISANIYYYLRLRGAQFHVIAQDGNPVNRVFAADSLLLAAGNRFDVLVRGGPPGTTILETLAYSTGPAGNQFPQTDLATVVSTGRPQPPTTLPTTFAPTEDLSSAHISGRRTIVFSENAAGTAFYINGKLFDPNRIDIRSRVNTVEEWLIRNDSNEEHSFHVHVNDFQVMSVNGVPQPFVGGRDTITLPVQGQVVIRTRLADYTGKTVLHCHILNHEDAGMMAVLDIVR
jgi:FtsP/CotA-like multicopper oxidase with cupredoxin domain